MNVEAMGGWTGRQRASRRFARSALIMGGSVLIIATLLCAVATATGQTGSGGPLGVLVAAAVCLVAGIAADGGAMLGQRASSPLVALLIGMTLRLLPPLVACLLIALRGGGREHLAFILYLLTFYMTTLALDTWWAVQRVSPSNH